MSRPKIQPDYNAEKVVKELINAVVESYEETGELKSKRQIASTFL